MHSFLSYDSEPRNGRIFFFKSIIICKNPTWAPPFVVSLNKTVSFLVWPIFIFYDIFAKALLSNLLPIILQFLENNCVTIPFNRVITTQKMRIVMDMNRLKTSSNFSSFLDYYFNKQYYNLIFP